MATEQRDKRRSTKRKTSEAGADAVSVMTPGAFEDAQTRLDVIIATLEEGRVPLAEALELHAEGARLYALCARMLEEADLRVMRLRALLPGSGGEGDQDGEAPDAGASGTTTSTSFYLEALELEDDE